MELDSGFCSIWRNWEYYCYFCWMECYTVVHHRVTPAFCQVAPTIHQESNLHPWAEKGSVRTKCLLAQEHYPITPERAQTWIHSLLCHCVSPHHNLIVNLINIYFILPTSSTTKHLWVWLVKIMHDFLPFRQDRTAGNISASTTISAKSTECFAIWLNAENMCRCKKKK